MSRSRVNIVSRMLKLTTCMGMEEQLQFMQRYPALMRICFMEYTINAMTDWLQCERQLLFPGLNGRASSGIRESFSSQQRQCDSAMATYSGIAVAMCDIFRQVRTVSNHAASVICI